MDTIAKNYNLKKSQNTIEDFYNVNKSDIGFIKFIFEAYEGIAVVSTLKTEENIIVVYTAPGCEDEVDEVIEELCKTIKMEKKNNKDYL